MAIAGTPQTATPISARNTMIPLQSGMNGTSSPMIAVVSMVAIISVLRLILLPSQLTISNEIASVAVVAESEIELVAASRANSSARIGRIG